MEFGLPVIVGRAQVAVHCSADMTGFVVRDAALLISLGNAHPFSMPAFLVARVSFGSLPENTR